MKVGDILSYTKWRLFFLIIFFAESAFSLVAQTQNKQIGFVLSAPWVNNYRFYDYQKQRKAYKSGFVGLGARLFYKNKNSKVVIIVY